MFNTYLYTPILNVLIFLYHWLGDSFGLAVVGLTVGIRAILIPLTAPAMRSQQKMMELAPKLAKLKKKHADKLQRQQAQLALYKSHGVNPSAGCLPQIVQIIILIALYQVFNNFLQGGTIDGVAVNMSFLWLDLAKPDRFYVLPILAGLTQLIYSLMLRPGTEHPHPPEKLVSKPAVKIEKDEMSMAAEIQNQMLFMMPLMTLVISLRFPAGLSLYWVVMTVFSIAQQWFVTGPGGLVFYWGKLRRLLMV